MSRLVFSENKGQGFKGQPATHWTHESAQWCTYMQGSFKTDPVQAAKEAFSSVHYCADNGPSEYVDGESLLSGEPVSVRVWGLVQSGNAYYWNGEVKSVTFTLAVVVEKE